MKVLITGGAGFIGAWIVKRLCAAGMTPVVFDLAVNRRVIAEIAGPEIADMVAFHVGDIADTAAVIDAAKGCDSIIHLAGLLTPACRADPVKGASVNLIGTLNVFLAARAHGLKRVLYMSSVGVFGPDGGDVPQPTTLYGAFKLAGEFSARAFFEDEGIASIGFRPYVVYGPGREHGLSAGPSLACRAAAEGKPYTIPFTGTVDLIHADDVAAAFEQALAGETRGAEVVTLFGVAADENAILASIRAAAPASRIDAAGAPMPISAPRPDGVSARLLPGWAPRSLDEGIADTIAFYRDRQRSGGSQP